MRINIFYKNIKPEDPLEVFIEDKIGRLDKIIGNSNSEARVELSLPSRHHRSGPVFYAEVNLKIDGKLLRAESRHADLRTAIVEVKDELQRQIKRFKGKKRDLSRQSKISSVDIDS